jgi:replication factor C small subunit
MLWTEKYRPKKIKEIIGQESFKSDAEHWIENGEMPNLLIFGPAGVGKTSAGISLAKEYLGDGYNLNFLELNASDDRRLEIVRTKIKEFASTGKMGDVLIKICLLDEMDGMTIDAQNALKRIMERYHSNVRFIITCNDRTKLVEPIQSRCANYFFDNLENDSICSLLNKILIREHGEAPLPEVMSAFVESFNGDLRRAISELQAVYATNESLENYSPKTLDKYNSILQMLIDSKQKEAHEKILKLLYLGVSIRDICIGLHDAIINGNYSNEIKFKFLRIIGETEYRSGTMTPRVIASWMIAQL